ncbi:hypothetical protein CF392_15990, partial [Tamilnaduibacter salinus]
MSVSVSSSGDYAISSHRDNVLVLWDLEDRQSDVLAENANIYSARFVRGRPAFIWQDLDNVVHVESVDGKQLRSFEHFPTYGHAMTGDLGTYLSVDDKWNVYAGYGDERKQVLSDGISPSFVGTGKLLNLSLSTEKERFLTAGSGSDKGRIADYPPISEERRFSRYGGVNLWGLSAFEPKARMSGFAAKTHATLSPDGEWVVGGDENGNLLYWNSDDPDTRHIAAVDGLGVPTMKRSGEGYAVVDAWNDEKLIPVPEGLEIHRPILHVSFIHGSEYYLRFNNDSDATALFKTGNPWPQ